MSDRTIKIAIESIADTAPIERTTAALEDVQQQSGGAAGAADGLADALESAGGAAKDAGREVTAAGEAAADMAGEAAGGADAADDLAGFLGKSAAGAAALGAAMAAAHASISLVVRLTREYIEVLKAEARAIDEQQTRNHAGAIEMTREAISRLGEEYDKLAAKRRADLAAQKDQITAEKEYNLAVLERQMQQAIAAAPDDEKRIRKEYGARAKVLGSASDLASIEADLAAAEQEQAAAEANAAEMREKETRANDEYDQAQQHKAAMERERDEKIAAAEARLPLDDPRRALYGNLYVDLVYDAPRNRRKRAEKVADEYEVPIEQAGKTLKEANEAAAAAQIKSKEAEDDAAAAQRKRDSLMQRADAQVIRGESAEIEQQRAGAVPLSQEDQAEIEAGQAAAQDAYDKADKLEQSAEASKGAAADALREMAAEDRAKGDAIIQALTEKFGAIIKKLTSIETAQQQDREASARAIAQINQQWADLAARVASLPS